MNSTRRKLRFAIEVEYEVWDHVSDDDVEAAVLEGPPNIIPDRGGDEGAELTRARITTIERFGCVDCAEILTTGPGGLRHCTNRDCDMAVGKANPS